jgi:hypothetical protein
MVRKQYEMQLCLLCLLCCPRPGYLVSKIESAYPFLLDAGFIIVASCVMSVRDADWACNNVPNRVMVAARYLSLDHPEFDI